jgi:hypothetical protein
VSTGPHWRVLLGHVILFGFIYPGERARIPAWVLDRLLDRLRQEMRTLPANGALCRGTLLSREQYLHDVQAQGYADARLQPLGKMSAAEIAAWTDAIEDSKG